MGGGLWVKDTVFSAPLIAWLQFVIALGLVALVPFVFRATRFLQLFPLRVFVTEWGHVPAVAALAVAISADRGSTLGVVTTVLAGLSAFAFLSPTLRARMAASSIREVIEPAFGPMAADPVRFSRLFALPRLRAPKFRRLEFPGPGGPLHCDFFPTPGDDPAPLIVAIHGGGWMGGETTEGADWAAWAHSKGWARASVHYRLSSEARWPAQRDDVLAAIEHLRAHAAELGIDADRLVLLGRSAGGQIATDVAIAARLDCIRGCISYYAPYDLHYAFEHARDDDALRSRCLIRDYLGGNPDAIPAQYDEASPSVTVRADSPPFLLFHGVPDELVSVVQSRRFARRLEEIGARHALVEYPWATHAFDYNRHGPAGQLTAACLAAFLDSVGKPRQI